MSKSTKKEFIIDRSVIDKLLKINPESGYFAFGLIYRTQAEWDALLSAMTGLGIGWGDATPGKFEESEAGGNLMIYIAVATGKCTLKYNYTTSHIDRPDLYNFDSSVEELLALLSGDFSVITLPQSRLLLNKNGAYYCLADSPGIMVNRKFGWDKLEYTWDFRAKAACKNGEKQMKALQEKFPTFKVKDKTKRVIITDFENKEIFTTEDPEPAIIYNPIEELDELLASGPPLVAKLYGLDAIFIGKNGYVAFHEKSAGNPIRLPDFQQIGQYMSEYKRQYIDTNEK